MSQINLKSISGITSITTPAGVDNRFSLYNFDSTERLVLDHSGNLNISGVSTATNFKTGFSNVHSVGFDVVSSTGAGCTIRESGNAVFSGIVTAAQFKGDGSNLSGLASREFYGFKTVNEDLILIHTNNGADNISKSDFESFEDSMTAPSGLSFTINSAGELEMTI
jgi:hypothetical protein